MNYVGIQAGHDSSEAVFEQGRLVYFQASERSTKIKHAYGIEDPLNAYKTLLKSTGGIAISTTQELPIIFPGVCRVVDETGFVQRLATDDFFKLPIVGESTTQQLIWRERDDLNRRAIYHFPDKFEFLNELDTRPLRSGQLTEVIERSKTLRRSQFHHAVRLDVAGSEYPLTFVQHHLAHAEYAFWASNADNALIISSDGGRGPTFSAGGYYFADRVDGVRPVAPGNFWTGCFYNRVAARLGLGWQGGAGKLMGLAPYGEPVFADPSFVGTFLDVIVQNRLPDSFSPWNFSEIFFDKIKKKFPRVNFDNLASWDKFTARPPKLVADIASSAQFILSTNARHYVEYGLELATKLNFRVSTIILSGGVGLNCPSNSQISGLFGLPLFVPPACNDEGLSIGCAVSAIHESYRQRPISPADFAENCYLGVMCNRVDVVDAATKAGYARTTNATSKLSEEEMRDVIQRLDRGEVVALFSGKAELGPRALGHRSILYDATRSDAWAVVNQIKRREPWRPFAPVVLDDDFNSVFTGAGDGDQLKRYMLVNYRVDSKDFPAITHFDHSSRVQSVCPRSGLIYSVLLAFRTQTGKKLLLNTSFNGPGTPIVDTAFDAFGEARKLGIDSVLTDYGLFRATKPPLI